ncbi:MAG: alkaline phosphatase family protein [Actinomycetota bacterium]
MALILLIGACTSSGSPEEPGRAGVTEPEDEFIPKKAYLKRACELSAEWVKLIHRGWDPGKKRDFDLVLVPTPPNYVGTLSNTSHSGPYRFLQEVPLILYGRGFVEPLGHIELDREVTLADVAPTYARLMRFDAWPERIGRPLSEVLKDTSETPKLIVTAVIDGGGWNVLQYWPDSWPNLKRIMDEGATIDNATVGSSPSITPSVHTTLSTATFPRFHGVTGINVRADDGTLVGAFSKKGRQFGALKAVPDQVLKMGTIADEWDKANGNEAKVLTIITGNFPLGMGGVGAAWPGGDHDILAVAGADEWVTNPTYYSMPDYVNTQVAGPETDIEALDRRDGEADGQWLGHEIKPLAGTPAFPPWQTRTLKALIEREGFGADDLTDLAFINYKSPDHAGHIWNMIAPEQEEVIRAVDAALADLVSWLDDNVGRDEYVVLVTADHGQTPLESGGWPISRAETIKDIQAQFDDIDNGRPVIDATSAVSLFLNAKEMKANGVTPEQVSSYLSSYTFRDNRETESDIPEEFRDRADERVFSAVFPGRKLPKVVRCTGAGD